MRRLPLAVLLLIAVLPCAVSAQIETNEYHARRRGVWLTDRCLD